MPSLLSPEVLHTAMEHAADSQQGELALPPSYHSFKQDVSILAWRGVIAGTASFALATMSDSLWCPIPCAASTQSE
jgi:hypothetical protein